MTKSIAQKQQHLNCIIDTLKKMNRLMVAETNVRILVQKTCNILVSTRGYYFAWCGVFDRNMEMETIESVGNAKRFEELRNNAFNGILPEIHKEVLATKTFKTYTLQQRDCSLEIDGGNWISFIAPILVDGFVKGLLSAAVPEEDADHPKEKQLFQDIANSLGYAISGIKEKQDLTEMMNLAPDGHIAFNRFLCITAVNKALCQMFNMNRNAVEGKSIQSFLKSCFSSIEHQKIEAAINELKDENDIDIELEFQGKTYRLFTKIKKLSKYRIAIFRDITKEKTEKEFLIQSEYKYRNLVNSLSDAVIVSQDGVIKYANPAVFKLSEYSEQELHNRYYSNFIARDEIDRILKIYKSESAKGDRTNYQSTVNNKSGKSIPVDITIIPVEFESKPAHQLIIRDISVQYEALQNLKESEERFRFLSQSSFEGIIIHDNGTILDINQAVLSLSGYTKDELLSRSIFDFLIKKEDAGKIKDNFLKEKPKPEVIELAIKNGDVVYCRIESQKINYQGKTVRITGIRNVTKEYKLTFQINDTRKKLSQLMNNLPGMAYTCEINEQWDMLFMSRGCFKLTGYHPEDFIHKKLISYNDLIHPDDRKMVWQNVQNSVKNKSDFELEYRIKTKEGKEKWVWEKGNEIIKENQSYIEGFISDITKRKRAEKALRKSEINYRTLFNSINDAIVIYPYDKEKVLSFVEVNEPACKMYGYSREELLKLTARDLTSTSENNKRVTKENRQRLINSGYSFYEIEQQTKNGRIITTEVSSRIIEIEGKKNIMSLIRNISDRKRAEKKILESEKYYRAVFENTGTATCIVEPDGTISLANEKFATLTGYKIDDLLNKKKWPEFIHPDSLDFMQIQNVIRQTKNGNALKNYLFKFIGKNKEVNIINLMVDVIPDTNKIIASLIDLTLQKEAQEKLKESEKLLNTVIQSMPSGFIMIDEDYRICKVNQQTCKITGYSQEELEGQFCKIICVGATESKKCSIWEEGLDSLEGMDTFVKCKDGTHTPVLKNSQSINIEGKKFILESIHDVSLWKKTEEELVVAKEKAEENHQKFAAFMEFLPGLAHIKDSNLNYLFVNRFMEKNLGERDWIHKNTRDVFAPDILQKVIDNDRRALKQGRHKFEEKLTVIGRGPREFLTHKFTINTNGNECLLGSISIDITERKELEKRATLLSKAIEVSPVSVIITNTNGEIEYVNPFFEKKTGYTIEEAKGKNPRILKSGEQDQAFYRDLWETILSGESWYGEFHNKSKSGELFWERANIAPMFNVKGKIVHFIAIKEDITELKTTLLDLHSAKEKAEQSDRLKSSFLANMSHEIRTPMNGILGFTDLLREPDLSGDEREEFIELIQKSGDRMLNTINDIIDISKIESGMETVNKSDMDLTAFLNDIYFFFLPEATKKDIDFKFANAKDALRPTFHTDPDKLNSIMVNLIKNAIKFTPNGSISFGYSLRESTIEFFVKDSGIGIPKDRQQAIFERFIQADIADSRVFEGSGLGLSISKMYTEMLEGNIKLESESGVGTTFFVTIPFHQQETKNSNIMFEIEKSIEQSNKKLNVLIAEDDEVSTQLLNIYLKAVAKNMISATNGREAVEMAKNNPDIDLILMDIKMPEMDGFEATERIRKFNQKVKIIAQTAFAQATDSLKAFEVGCDDFVTKPVNKKALLESINNVFL